MVALQQPESDDAERRIAPRTRTLKRAKVIFNNGFSTFDCIVRNISATGALLTIDEAAHLPKGFDVRFGEDRESRPAKLVYRRGLFAGIRFLDISEENGGEPATENEATSPQHAKSAAMQPASHHGEMSDAGATIRRIAPEILPTTLVKLFAWSNS